MRAWKGGAVKRESGRLRRVLTKKGEYAYRPASEASDEPEEPAGSGIPEAKERLEIRSGGGDAGFVSKEEDEAEDNAGDGEREAAFGEGRSQTSVGAEEAGGDEERVSLTVSMVLASATVRFPRARESSSTALGEGWARLDPCSQGRARCSR